MTATHAAKAANTALLAAFLAALVLTGCGRKGPLETPPARGTVQNDDGTAEEPAAGRRFILDPLIQ
jgi:predicted small lipoprotein YifL